MNNTSLLASFKAFDCPRCETSYLLFKKGALCPNCKYEETEEAENTDFIASLLEVMTRHKRKYDRYTPNSWFVENVSDKVSSLCFQVFDRLEKERSEDDHQTKIKKILDDMDWRNKVHMKIHVREVIAELYKRYIEKKPRHTLFSKIRTFIFA